MQLWWSTCALVCLSCGPGSAGRAVQPSAPTYANATGALACTTTPTLARPLAVDWRPEDRADLEVAMKQGLAVVAYDCKQARVLRDCRVDGSYGFVGTTTKEQLIRLTGSDEVRINMPFFGAKIGGDIRRDAALDVALAMVGQEVASRPLLAKSDLKGDCEGATHFVRAATVGAFVMRTGTAGRVAAAADVLSMGANGSSSSVKDVVNKDGDPTACRASDPDAKAPAKQCGSLLRLELKALSEKPATLGQDPFVEYATESSCPRGTVFEAGKCALPEGGTPHLCDYGDAKDCKIQCDAGNAASCTRFGLMHERGEGVAKDASMAAGLYDKACNGDDVPACSRLGVMLLEGVGIPEDGKRAMSLLHKACMAGWSRACSAQIAYFSKTHAADSTKVVPLVQRGCEGGDGDSCATLGMLHQEGVGLVKDPERATYFFKRGCSASSKLGCVLLGEAYLDGRGVDKDPERAAELFTMACQAKDSAACDREAKLYFLGEGVKKDEPKGIELLGRACDLGSAGSCLVLGLRYQHGTGVGKDNGKADALFKRACDGGQSIACEQLKAK
jgi:uncharacterized protein